MDCKWEFTVKQTQRLLRPDIRKTSDYIIPVINLYDCIQNYLAIQTSFNFPSLD